MQRSKQQALMFLLGAVLVGGVLGFSADRVMTANKGPHPMERRGSFYDEFGITADQRVKIDSIFDETNCKLEEIMGPVRPRLEAIKKESRREWQALLTKEQLDAFTAREARMKARRDSVEKARAAERARDGRSDDHRCASGTPPRPMGPSGPGGPFFR